MKRTNLALASAAMAALLALVACQPNNQVNMGDTATGGWIEADTGAMGTGTPVDRPRVDTMGTLRTDTPLRADPPPPAPRDTGQAGITGTTGTGTASGARGAVRDTASRGRPPRS